MPLFAARWMSKRLIRRCSEAGPVGRRLNDGYKKRKSEQATRCGTLGVAEAEADVEGQG